MWDNRFGGGKKQKDLSRKPYQLANLFQLNEFCVPVTFVPAAVHEPERHPEVEYLLHLPEEEEDLVCLPEEEEDLVRLPEREDLVLLEFVADHCHRVVRHWSLCAVQQLGPRALREWTLPHSSPPTKLCFKMKIEFSIQYV